MYEVIGGRAVPSEAQRMGVNVRRCSQDVLRRRKAFLMAMAEILRRRRAIIAGLQALPHPDPSVAGASLGTHSRNARLRTTTVLTIWTGLENTRRRLQSQNRTVTALTFRWASHVRWSTALKGGQGMLSYT